MWNSKNCNNPHQSLLSIRLRISSSGAGGASRTGAYCAATRGSVEGFRAVRAAAPLAGASLPLPHLDEYDEIPNTEEEKRIQIVFNRCKNCQSLTVRIDSFVIVSGLHTSTDVSSEGHS